MIAITYFLHVWSTAVAFRNKFRVCTLRHHFFVTGQVSSNQSDAITKKGAAVKSANSRTNANISNESSKANSQQQNLNVHTAAIATSSEDENRVKTNGKVKSLNQVR